MDKKAEHEDWAALKKAAADRGWPTVAFDYGHEPQSQEEAEAWKHWDESPAWQCNECGEETTYGVGERAAFTAGWRRHESLLREAKNPAPLGDFDADKMVEVEYLESGTFQGGEEQCFTAGIKSGDECVVLSRAHATHVAAVVAEVRECSSRIETAIKEGNYSGAHYGLIHALELLDRLARGDK